MPLGNSLDEEHVERIDELEERYLGGNRITEADVFLSQEVANSISLPKIILPSYDLTGILANYAFGQRQYVLMCPRCQHLESYQDLVRLLERDAFTPVLACDYRSYPESFLKTVVRFPHISCHEFIFYRHVILTSANKTGLCPHCVEKYHEACRSLAKRETQNPKLGGLVDQCVRNLEPFMGPDGDLLVQLKHALEQSKLEEARGLIELSLAVHELRTAEAYRASYLIPARLFRHVQKQMPFASKLRVLSDLQAGAEVAKNALTVAVPAHVDVDKYMDAVAPYRREMGDLAQSLLEESSGGDGLSISDLTARLAELNAQVNALSENPRFLAIEAAVTFVKANRALLASGLIATILGLTGNFIGCGVSLLGGIGAEIAGKKIRLPEEASAVVQTIESHIRPSVQRLLAKYAGADVRAVQVYEMRKHNKEM